jgi:hypothetical protein
MELMNSMLRSPNVDQRTISQATPAVSRISSPSLSSPVLHRAARGDLADARNSANFGSSNNINGDVSYFRFNTPRMTAENGQRSYNKFSDDIKTDSTFLERLDHVNKPSPLAFASCPDIAPAPWAAYTSCEAGSSIHMMQRISFLEQELSSAHQRYFSSSCSYLSSATTAYALY